MTAGKYPLDDAIKAYRLSGYDRTVGDEVAKLTMETARNVTRRHKIAESDAVEIVQEVTIKLLEHLEAGGVVGKGHGYVRQMVWHKISDYFDRAHRKREVGGKPQENLAAQSTRFNDPKQADEISAKQRVLDELVEQACPNYRRAIGHLREGGKPAELGEIIYAERLAGGDIDEQDCEAVKAARADARDTAYQHIRRARLYLQREGPKKLKKIQWEQERVDE